MKEIRIATRASKLAIVQAKYVAALLEDLDPSGIVCRLVEVTTSGDKDKRDFLFKTGQVAHFTSEVEATLLEDRADVAVHSLKDLPTACTEGLTIAAIPPRQVPNDALVCQTEISGPEVLPEGSKVGTSSIRRIAIVQRLWPHLECAALRGNVETRVNKVYAGEYDAAIMACAGLVRLGMEDRIRAALDTNIFVPAPGQGALAVQSRCSDEQVTGLVQKLDDPKSRIAVETERLVLAKLHGGCNIPLGAYAQISSGSLSMKTVLVSPDGKQFIEHVEEDRVGRAAECADRAAEKLMTEGGAILEEIRQGQN